MNSLPVRLIDVLREAGCEVRWSPSPRTLTVKLAINCTADDITDVLHAIDEAAQRNVCYRDVFGYTRVSTSPISTAESPEPFGLWIEDPARHFLIA